MANTTIEELLDLAYEVRDADQAGENTALRVGGLLEEIIQYLSTVVGLDTLQATLEQYATVTGGGLIYWRHSRIICLASMGYDLDNIDGGNWNYTNFNGDIVFRPSSGSGGGFLNVVGTTGDYSVFQNVVYVNNHTGHAYLWKLVGNTYKMVEIRDSSPTTIINYLNTPPFSQVAVGETYYYTSGSTRKIAIKLSSDEVYSFDPDPKKIYVFLDTKQAMVWDSGNRQWISVGGNLIQIINDLVTGGGDKALSAEMGLLLKSNVIAVQANIQRLYNKLANMAFWTASDRAEAAPTALDWRVPKKTLAITNNIEHGVVKYNGNVVSGSIQVDQGTTVNLLVEGETGYGLLTAAATGATVVDNGNGTFTVSVKVDSTMSLTITGTAAALVTPSFICSNDADALSLTGASAAVGGTFVGTIAIEDDYFDGFSIEGVKDGSDNDVTYTTSGNTITISSMPSVLVITAKATKVLKFYANKAINGMGSVVDDSGTCFTDLIRLDGLTSSVAMDWVHNIAYDSTKNRAIVFYDKNKKHMMNWNSNNYKDCPYHFVVNSSTARQFTTSQISSMLQYTGGLAYVRACFDLDNDGKMNTLNALTQGSSSWLDPSNTESADDLVVHNITYSLTGCTTNASSATTSHPARTNIIDGENFQDTINVGSGKTLQSVTVTMDGVDITSTVYNSSTKTIVIASVTGALVITATAS